MEAAHEMSLNKVDGHRRMPEHGYTISSPCEPDYLGELKITIGHQYLLFAIPI